MGASQEAAMKATAFVLVPVLAAAGCDAGTSSDAQATHVTVVQASVALGDPHIVSDSVNRLNILLSVYEALVGVDEQGAYTPMLAERWSVADDARAWTFVLRRGVTFHNGETLRAADVVASIRRALDPAIGGSFGTQGVLATYLGTAEVRALDESTVRIVTAEPMADLLDLMAAILIGPERDLPRLPTTLVGSGPYRIASQADGRVVLAAHDRYWGPAPRYPELRFVAEPDARKRVDALSAGEADLATGIGIEGKARLAAAGGAAAHERESGLCIIYMLNAQNGPCKDRRVRQALNYALDVDAIIAGVMKGGATRLNGYLTAHHFGYNPETPPYPHDPEKARQLLAEAGYGKGLTLVIDIPSTMPDEAPALTRMMAEQYTQVGITVKVVEHADRAAYSEMVRDKKINDGCCFDSSPRSTFRVLREKLHSGLRGPWWEGYQNPQVDALIEQAQATVAEADRQRLYRQIYTIVRDDAPWVFLYRPTNYWGVRPTITGWTPRPDGLVLLR
jgi:peptide/nickel transport system substrate-binding protein